MSKLIYNLRIPVGEIRTSSKLIFNEFKKLFPDACIGEPDEQAVLDIMHGTKMRVNWACIWNSPKLIGKRCKVVWAMQNICFVEFDPREVEVGKYGGIKRLYRIEDLSPEHNLKILNQSSRLVNKKVLE